MTQAANVCNQLDPITGEPIDAITATNLRRHHGNTLVVAPVRHVGGGVFEQAKLNGVGGYFYPSQVGTSHDPEPVTLVTFPGWNA